MVSLQFVNNKFIIISFPSFVSVFEGIKMVVVTVMLITVIVVIVIIIIIIFFFFFFFSV